MQRCELGQTDGIVKPRLFSIKNWLDSFEDLTFVCPSETNSSNRFSVVGCQRWYYVCRASVSFSDLATSFFFPLISADFQQDLMPIADYVFSS